jgi:DNA-binding SARP family transcriptional activator/tetratricopeptide (TPR) repeat protein
MALLALVASAGKRGISRERVAGILWGEAGEEHARHSLSQNLYTLRRETGRDWIHPAPKLILNSTATSDVADFLEAYGAGDFVRATELYTGPFLQDFHLTGAAEFERWVDEERATLRRAALRALEALATRAGNGDSVRWWRRLTELDGLNGQYAAGLIRSLMSTGDLVAALAYARAHEDLVRIELEAEVDPAVRALIASLRTQAGRQLTTPEDSAPSEPPIDAKTPDRGVRRPQWFTSRSVAAGAALGILAVTATLAALRRDAQFDTSARLAVGAIQSADTTAPAAVLRDMLATSLDGIPELGVVANSRLLELSPPGDSTSAAIANAARRAGADEIFEGELTRSGGGLQLTLRRISLESGDLKRGYTVRAANQAALIDSAATAIARDLGVPSPVRPVATQRTASPAAYALYERGLQAYYRGDPRTAHTLMRAAWEEDTTFAMAAFYGWLASTTEPLPRDQQLLEAARRLAPRAVDRERLLIASVVSGRDSSILTAVAMAESLAVRYPEDPEAHMALGAALELLGDFPRAIAVFERAVAIDSAVGAATGPSCRLCNALYLMSRSYAWSDSLDAALRTGRRIRRLRPAETTGWAAMAEPLFRLGRREEAQAGLDSGIAGSIVSDQHQELGRRDLIRWGEFESVDRQLVADLAHFSPDARNNAAWLMLISLRNQGRLREAMDLASRRIIPGTGAPAAIEPQDLHVAVLAMEGGDPAKAARWFLAQADAIRRSPATPGTRARGVTWNLTLAGTALAMAGDTAGVAGLVDDVERNGRGSNFGRDLKLHHYLRGLVHHQGGRHEEAIAEFRKALFSLSDGYTQINHELARCLMRVGRPGEAIAVLRPALRGGVDGSNTYVTFTVLHEAIAQAFEQAGAQDSARAHWTRVERAWRRADPVFADRYAYAKARAGPL